MGMGMGRGLKLGQRSGSSGAAVPQQMALPASNSRADGPANPLSGLASGELEVVTTLTAVTGNDHLFGVWRTTAATRAASLFLTSANKLAFWVSNGATVSYGGQSTAAVTATAGQLVSFKASMAANGDITLFENDVVIGSTTIAGWTTFSSATTPLTVGAAFLGSDANVGAKVHSAVVRDGPGGSALAVFDPANLGGFTLVNGAAVEPTP